MDNLDSRLARVRSIRGSSCAAARPGILGEHDATAEARFRDDVEQVRI